MNRIPFNPYDFFGYLASGLTIVVGMNTTLGFPPVLGADLNFVDGAFLLIAIYVAGQLIATPAKAFLEDGLVDKVLGRPNANLFLEKQPCVRGLLFPGFYQPLPKQRQERILARAASEGVTGTGEDFFLHVRFHPEIRNDEKLKPPEPSCAIYLPIPRTSIRSSPAGGRSNNACEGCRHAPSNGWKKPSPKPSPQSLRTMRWLGSDTVAMVYRNYDGLDQIPTRNQLPPHFSHRPLQSALRLLHADQRAAILSARRVARAGGNCGSGVRGGLISVGFRKFRLTGGEPTLRHDLLEIVRRMGEVEGVGDLAMTTNGILLPELARGRSARPACGA